MRLSVACVATLAVTVVLGELGVIPAHAAKTTTSKPAVRVPEDKALVYFVRPKRPGSRLMTFLYIDDEFVGVLEDNSFTYVLVEEGRHVLWTFLTVDVPKWFRKVSDVGIKAVAGGPLLERPWEGSQFEVLGGRTYYFGFADPYSTRNTHLKLDGREGADRVDRVKFYATASGKETEASALHLAERGAEAVEQFEATYIAIPDYPTPPKPLDVTDLIQVDAKTEISLELVQNLWSERHSSGDGVWLRVTEDVASAEGVWLREGTLVRGLVVHAEGRRSSVRGGVLDVAIPAVVAVDGTVVPTQGAMLESGGGFSSGSRVAAFLLSAWYLVVTGEDIHSGRGRAAFLPLGAKTAVYTRDPVWIAPTTRAIDAVEGEAGSSGVRLRLGPRAIRMPGVTWPRLRFLVGRPERPAVVRVRSIAGQSPPVEIEAETLTRVPEGWRCAFDWWQVVKFLPTKTQGHIPLELEGVFEDGTPFVVEVPVLLDLPLQR